MNDRRGSVPAPTRGAEPIYHRDSRVGEAITTDGWVKVWLDKPVYNLPESTLDGPSWQGEVKVWNWLQRFWNLEVRNDEIQ